MSSYSELTLVEYSTTSEINKKGINFISSPWNYFQVTSEKTAMGGKIDMIGNLTLAGNALKTGGGSWDSYSDIRIKNIKNPFFSSLTALLKLSPVVFEYTKDELKSNNLEIGLIAQEAEKVAPHLVTEKEITFEDGETIKDFKILNPSSLVYMCINSIKDLHSEIETLKERIIELESEKDS